MWLLGTANTLTANTSSLFVFALLYFSITLMTSVITVLYGLVPEFTGVERTVYIRTYCNSLFILGRYIGPRFL